MKKSVLFVICFVLLIGTCSCGVKYVGDSSVYQPTAVPASTELQYHNATYVSDVFHTADWMNYVPDEPSMTAALSLDLPSDFYLTDSIIYNEKGEKAGEILPIVKLFPDQTALDTYLVKYTGKKPNEIRRGTIKAESGVIYYLENEAVNGSGVWYAHSYYVTRNDFVGIVTFYSDESEIDDETKEIFEKCANSVSVVPNEIETTATVALTGKISAVTTQ